MSDIRIAGLQKRIGENAILSDIDLTVAEGEYIVVVGPSGCGKSTLLRTVAGLEDVSAGSIALGGRDITHLAPADRGVAMVFQSYALYPNMTVRQNLGFALRMAKRPASEIAAAVDKAAAILDIEHLLDRKPAALSGGQRQRVAIGRAIVRQPDLFLFDEPLSNLDTELRVKMRHEFLRLHKTLGTTTLYVTHDQTEAMTLADRIVVLRAGKIEQIGTPDELYQRPANQFVAGFIGSPQMNFIDAVVDSVGTIAGRGQLSVRLPQGDVIALPLGAAPGRLQPGDRITLGVRPDDLLVSGRSNGNGGENSGGGGLTAKVDFVERMGGQSLVHLDACENGPQLLWQIHGDTAPAVGTEIVFDLGRAPALHIFGEDGKRIETAP